MGYNKFLVVASKKDKAGMNIATNLSQFRKNRPDSAGEASPEERSFDFYLADEEIVFTENLDMEKISNYDFVIFASRHSSGKGEKALAMHTPGNFRSADFGGEKGKVSRTSALFQKHLFEKLGENADKHGLDGFQITLEATHHGPLIDKPCLFIEIGSTEADYGNRKAGFVVAKAISEAIWDFTESPYHEIAIAIGGPHYCPNFNKLQMSSNIAISHVISQYAFPLTEEMIREAVSKTDEEIDLAVLDWKGLGNAEQRKEVLDVLDRLYIRYEKTSNISKG
jgi:D-aminoacyl-tRNA deacylase